MKKFTTRDVKIIISSSMLFLFLTACEENVGPAPKVTDDSKTTNIKEFVDLLRSADPKNRVALIEDFESRNNVNLSDSMDVIRPIVLKNSGVETAIEYVGDQTYDLGPPVGYTNQHISWVVVRNLFNWWEIKSHDIVSHDAFQVFEAQHLYSGLEGFDFSVIEWTEKYSETQTWATTAIINVQGYLRVSLTSNELIDNYCTAQIPVVEDPSDSSGVIIIN